MTEADIRVVEVETRIEAPPERVFEYLVDPKLLERWLGSEVEADARPGGAYSVRVMGNDAAAGSFVSIEPPRRVVMTWGWVDPTAQVPAGSTTVEVTLHAEGDGTRLRLRHSDLPTAEWADKHQAGWDAVLGRLADAAA